MLYIDKPEGCELKKDSDDYYYFALDNGTHIRLRDVVDYWQEHRAGMPVSGSEQVISVHRDCPRQDKPYIQYLEKTRPSGWAKEVNGLGQNRFSDSVVSRCNSWINKAEGEMLSAERRAKVKEQRQRQKEDRYNKGPSCLA